MTTDQFISIRKVGGERYQAFIDAGYREYYQTTQWSHTTPYLLQKALRGPADNRTFFVDVWCYDWSDTAREDTKFSVQPECQFNANARDGSPTFSVVMHAPSQYGPSEIEAFFQSIYDRMNCAAYETEGDT